jgi:hypothetical protein
MGSNSFCANVWVRVVLVVAFSFLFGTAVVGQAKPERQSKAAKPEQATKTAQPAAPAATDDEATPENNKPEEKVFKGMKYRLIGPFRGGRSLTAAGVPGGRRQTAR